MRVHITIGVMTCLLQVPAMSAASSEARWEPRAVLDEATYQARVAALPPHDERQDAAVMGLVVDRPNPGEQAERLGMVAGTLVTACDDLPILGPEMLTKRRDQVRRIGLIDPSGAARTVTAQPGPLGFANHMRWQPQFAYVRRWGPPGGDSPWLDCARAIGVDRVLAEDALGRAWRTGACPELRTLLAFALLSYDGEHDAACRTVIPEVIRIIKAPTTAQDLRHGLALHLSLFYAARGRYVEAGTWLRDEPALQRFHCAVPRSDAVEALAYRSLGAMPDGPDLAADLNSANYNFCSYDEMASLLKGGRYDFSVKKDDFNSVGVLLASHPRCRFTFDVEFTRLVDRIPQFSFEPSPFTNPDPGGSSDIGDGAVHIGPSLLGPDFILYARTYDAHVGITMRGDRQRTASHFEFDRFDDMYEIRVDGCLAARFSWKSPWRDVTFLRMFLHSVGSVSRLRAVALDDVAARVDHDVEDRGRTLLQRKAWTEAAAELDRPGLAQCIRMQAIVPYLQMDPPRPDRALELALLDPGLLRNTNAKMDYRLANGAAALQALYQNDVTREGLIQAIIDHRCAASQDNEFQAILAYLVSGDLERAIIAAEGAISTHTYGPTRTWDWMAWLYAYSAAALSGKRFPTADLDQFGPLYGADAQRPDATNPQYLIYQAVRGARSFEVLSQTLDRGWQDDVALLWALRLHGTGHHAEAMEVVASTLANPPAQAYPTFTRAGLLSLRHRWTAPGADRTPLPARWQDPMPTLPPVVESKPEGPSHERF